MSRELSIYGAFRIRLVGKGRRILHGEANKTEHEDQLPLDRFA